MSHFSGADFNFYSAGHIDPPAAHLLVWLTMLGAVYVIGFAIKRGIQARMHGRRAATLFDPDAILAPGHAYIAGVVELAFDQTEAIRVEIQQVGTEHKYKNSWSHKWKEAGRSVVARPFYVKLQSGERVRVEPDDDVLLVDQLDKMHWPTRHNRVRTAELSAGEQVIVEGHLDHGYDPELKQAGGGYRDAKRGWVMRGEAGDPIHVSAEPLSDRHRQRGNRMFGAAAWAFLLLAVAQIGVYGYAMRVLQGASRVGTVLDTDHWTTRGSKGSIHHHYNATVQYREYAYANGSDGEDRTFEDEINRNAFQTIDVGDTVMIRLVPPEPRFSSFGKNSSVAFWGWLFEFVCFLVAVFVVRAAHRKKPWYEGPVNEGGSGRLPAPKGTYTV